MKSDRETFDNSTRQSTWFYRSDKYNRGFDYSSSLYSHMLIEDIHLGLLPVSPTVSPGPIIKIDPPTQDNERLVCDALNHHHGRARTPYRAVERFVSDVAGTVAYFGEAFYEIVYFKNEGNEYRSFVLIPIPNWGLKKGLKYFVQMQPRNGTLSNSRVIQKIKIPVDDVVHFRISSSTLAPRMHRRLLRKLAKLSNRTTLTKFMSSEEQNCGFDFSHYHKNEILHVARLTKRMGWYARQLYQDQTNEFYLIYRYLTFDLWKARFRESLITTLNEALEKAGNKIGLATRIKIEGVPTSADIEKIINDFKNGKIEFSSAIKKSHNG